MPDPTFLQTPYKWHQRQMVWYGGLPVPVFNTNLAWVDLNDRVAWSCVGSPQIDNTHISNKSSQLAWRGKGVWLAQDFVGRKIRVAAHFDETSGTPFSRAKAYLTQSGEQYISFDGGLTGLPVRTNSFAESTFLTGAPEAPGQYVHQVELEFLSRNAFARDVNITTAVGQTLVQGNNTFAIAYSGMVFAEPVFNISIPNTNPAITSIYVANQSSGETLALSFGAKPLAAGVTHSVQVYTDSLTIIVDGITFPPSGSFPYVYPSFPPPATNNMLVAVNSAGGAALSGVSLSVQFYNQWEI